MMTHPSTRAGGRSPSSGAIHTTIPPPARFRLSRAVRAVRSVGYAVLVSEPTRRLVLVPGLGLDDRSSARLRQRLPADVVLLPGMGLAAPVPSLDVLARRLLAEIGSGPVVLVGHSQSC